MSIWNKVLIGLILATSPAFFFFAARALATHRHWRVAAAAFQEKIEELRKENILLQDGDVAEGIRGVRQAKLDLHKLLLDRGRVWRNVTPGALDLQTGTLLCTTDLPDPNGIAKDTVLYVFEERPLEEGGRYLGAFKVKNTADKRLELEPAVKLTEDETKQLQQPRGPWVLRDVIPVDDHEIFAGLDEAKIRAMFPEATVDEYLKHGQKGPDGKPYTRELRDYGVLLTSYHKHRAVLAELIAAANRDKSYLQAALADARDQQLKFRNDDFDRLKGLLTEETRQLDAVKNHLKAVQDKLAELRNGVDQLIKANQQTAGQVAQLQLEAIRRIDEQTNRMARLSSD